MARTGKASYTAGNFLYASAAATIGERTPAQVLTDIGAASTSHTHTLVALSDTTITTPAAGEILKYDSVLAKWINSTLAEAGISATGHTHEASAITSGTFADARIAASNVSQHAVEASTASTVVKRDASGDLKARLYRSEYANGTTISGAIAFRINNTTDNYIRFCSDPDAIRTFLSAASRGANTFTGVQTATGFTVSSSRALKQDISALDVPADTVDLFQPVTFRYKSEPDKEVAGLIREDVAEIFPFAVTEEGIDYGQLVPLLLMTMQRDRAQLRELTQRVAALEGKRA